MVFVLVDQKALLLAPLDCIPVLHNHLMAATLKDDVVLNAHY
jgi:hypothetical protein